MFIMNGGILDDGFAPRDPAPRPQPDPMLRTEIKDLTEQVERLALLNQALWELLVERAGLTNADLERKAAEIDLRDGNPDGKMTSRAVRCPRCNRVCNSRHSKCLYCGQLFEKPIFG
jgi:hypothetical protein